MDFFESLADNLELESQFNSTYSYSAWFCSQISLSCHLTVTMGQNLFSMFATLKIQSMPVKGNVFANSNSTHPQTSSGTFLCASIDIASGGFSTLFHPFQLPCVSDWSQHLKEVRKCSLGLFLDLIILFLDATYLLRDKRVVSMEHNFNATTTTWDRWWFFLQRSLLKIEVF